MAAVPVSPASYGSQTISWQDFARERSESEYPELWDGLEGFWCPGLGPTGTKLINVGLQLKDRQMASFVNLDAGAWTFMPELGWHGLEFYNNATDGAVDAGIGHIDDSRNEITLGGFIRRDATPGGVADWRLMARAFSTSGATHRYMLGGATDGVRIRTRFLISGSVITDVGVGTGIPNGEPFMLSASYDGANVRHYVNGLVHETFAHAGTLQPNDDAESAVLLLGANPSSGGTYGTMDCTAFTFWIYSRKLSDQEQMLLSAIPAAPLVPRPVMVSAFVPGAPPPGLDIPIAMHHYKQLMGAN